MRRTRVAPIGASDLERVGDYLSMNLNKRISGADWVRAARVPWSVDAPNHGFMLLDESDIVGVYLAFYSSRMLGGRLERFCNLGAWCVSPEYRLYSLQLLRALLAQPGYHFTDLSPSGNTLRINERLKFKYLDTTTALMVNLPLRSWSGRTKVSTDPDDIEGALDGPQRQIYRDHRGAQAAHHLLLTHRDEHCYVIFRRDRRKGLPVFASVLHVSNPPLFQCLARFLGWHLLVRHLLPLTLMELRVVGGQPPGSFLLRWSRRKMYKSDSLRPDQIDDLYSELVCVSW